MSRNLLKKIRVLIVDDSYFMKKLLSEMLSSVENIEVIGTAKNGKEAVTIARTLKPDVITMDYNMPELNGVQALKQILATPEAGEPGIIMVSAYTGAESETALAALHAGAVDFIQKPSGELSFDIEKIKDELIEKIVTASQAKIRHFAEHQEQKNKKNLPSSLQAANKIIVIGASTGGPPLLEEILKILPKNIAAAIIVVQHMPNFFTQKFAERLDKILPMPVRWVQEADPITVGTVFVTPAQTELKIKNNNQQNIFCCAAQSKDYVGIRPSIDRTMTEIAKNYGENAIGVILTGMGEDGLLGMAAIKKYGGITIAQDPETATIDSMPDAIIRAKLADEILRPENIANRLLELINQNK